ncbi:hypothetical protein IGM_01936 [Bacillus cereus HuB4-4]|uniref:Uncharacterized protein n=1 Tax=Bacillus cereus HuB4-4 TaxID=1053211 RepID=A0A9W5VMR2_BACCE|nr:hypothetical protein [Bacillus cereus]EOP91876.1 hypothetical protein IGM_01936 [Bacillus cereus HuB4-4]
MNEHNIWVGVIILILLVYVIRQQVTPRTPKRFHFYTMPVVALFATYKNFHYPITGILMLNYIISVGVSIFFGYVQAGYIKLHQVNSVWVMQGDGRYVVSWLALLIVKVGIRVIFIVLGHKGALHNGLYIYKFRLFLDKILGTSYPLSTIPINFSQIIKEKVVSDIAQTISSL